MGAPLYEKMGFSVGLVREWIFSKDEDRSLDPGSNQTARTRTRTAFARGRPKLWPRDGRRGARGAAAELPGGSAPRVPSCPVSPRVDRDGARARRAPILGSAAAASDGFCDDEADAFFARFVERVARHVSRSDALTGAVATSRNRSRFRGGGRRPTATGVRATRRAAEALRRAGLTGERRRRGCGGGWGAGRRAGPAGRCRPREGGAAVDRRELRPRVKAHDLNAFDRS